jgi:hypothetical protein
MSDSANRSAQDAWVSRVLGVETKSGRKVESVARARASEQWRAARETVLATLKDLETSIRSMNDPLSDDAVILVRAIAANLTAQPQTPQQINELKRYLQNDTIIDDAESENGFGIKVEIRTPLISALLAMERTMA